MKKYAVLIILFSLSSLVHSKTPEWLNKVLRYQSPQEWHACLSSAHADVLRDADVDSPLIGVGVASLIEEVSDILVSVPQPEKPGTRLSPACIYSSMMDYVLSAAQKVEAHFDTNSDRWIEVSGDENTEYTVVFVKGEPKELYLRKDKGTLIRFGLLKR